MGLIYGDLFSEYFSCFFLNGSFRSNSKFPFYRGIY